MTQWHPRIDRRILTSRLCVSPGAGGPVAANSAEGPRAGVRRRVAACCLRVAAWLLLVFVVPSQSAWSQTYWELSPYHVYVMVAFAPGPECPPRMQSDFVAGLVQQADALIGAPWQVEAGAAPPDLRYRILRGEDLGLGQPLSGKAPAEGDAGAAAGVFLMPDELMEKDKVILLGVAPTLQGYRLVAREFDVHTRRWSLPATRHVEQATLLQSEAFGLLLDVFSPLARVIVSRSQGILLKLRGSRLRSQDPSWRMVEVGALFEPIVRRNDRQGNPIGIRPIPSTFLRVISTGDEPSAADEAPAETPDAEVQAASSEEGTQAPATPQSSESVQQPGIDVRCDQHTRLRDPLNVLRRGRNEVLGLLVHVSRDGDSQRDGSLLQLRSRDDEARPLAGYDVYAREIGRAHV